MGDRLGMRLGRMVGLEWNTIHSVCFVSSRHANQCLIANVCL